MRLEVDRTGISAVNPEISSKDYVLKLCREDFQLEGEYLSPQPSSQCSSLMQQQSSAAVAVPSILMNKPANLALYGSVAMKKRTHGTISRRTAQVRPNFEESDDI